MYKGEISPIDVNQDISYFESKLSLKDNCWGDRGRMRGGRNFNSYLPYSIHCLAPFSEPEGQLDKISVKWLANSVSYRS